MRLSVIARNRMRYGAYTALMGCAVMAVVAVSVIVVFAALAGATAAFVVIFRAFGL